MIQVVHPGSQIRILTFYPSRIPGSKRHRSRIRNTDAPTCLFCASASRVAEALISLVRDIIRRFNASSYV